MSRSAVSVVTLSSNAVDGPRHCSAKVWVSWLSFPPNHNVIPALKSLITPELVVVASCRHVVSGLCIYFGR